jgi:hypothetical protein
MWSEASSDEDSKLCRFQIKRRNAKLQRDHLHTVQLSSNLDTYSSDGEDIVSSLGQ